MKGKEVMRVIAGSARRLLLASLPGNDTRPTTDRIKETLFNILQGYVPGATFLDLFGGSGAIAIEALSRGASHAVIVEKNPKAVAVIEQNLQHTRLFETAEVISGDAISAIGRLSLSKRNAFDLIFLDPPYGKGLEDMALSALIKTPLVNEDTLLIVEMKADANVSHFEAMGYMPVRIKEYKTNKHIFLRKGSRNDYGSISGEF